ncbi:hypothetical protein LCGC14_2129000, partial [marine sediment metagenome]
MGSRNQYLQAKYIFVKLPLILRSLPLSILFGILISCPAFSQTSGAWRLFETKHPVDKKLVALHINDAAGEVVDSSGSIDVTGAFQKAIDLVFGMGGGAIYVPEGRYRFDGSLIIKEGINLRGDFLERAKKYYKHVLKFGLCSDDNTWQRIKILAEVRNVIAHANDRLDMSNENTKR